MAFNFSANQFENAFRAKRLCNWEVPKWYPPRPRQRKCATRIIANDRGHLLPFWKRSDDCPWGYYKGTYQLPRKLTRKAAAEINDKLIGKGRFKKFERAAKNFVCPPPVVEEEDKPVLEVPKKETIEVVKDTGVQHTGDLDLEYVPGDFTPYKHQHVSRDILLRQKYERDNNIEPELELNELYLEESQYKDPFAGKKGSASAFPIIQNTTDPDIEDIDDNQDNMNLFMNHSITEKPHEYCPTPVISAHTNFEIARKMHQENLDHQPLPDCIADQAFRKLQAEGKPHPGLALHVDPVTTGVGVKTYQAGPNHCTKVKVYRPKTCGVVPKVYKDTSANHRPFSSVEAKKMGSMDLAICWDYRPPNPADEPQRPRHIDGSDDSAGPAVFTYVKSPRTPDALLTGRSAGVFNSTFGEQGFFDKDIMRRKTDFAQAARGESVKCTCGTSPIAFKGERNSRAKSVSRSATSKNEGREYKRYQSSPNLSQFQVSEYTKENNKPSREHSCRKYGSKKNSDPQPGFFRRTARMCHKVAPQPYPEEKEKDREEFKVAFRAGVPKQNAAGTIGSADSGCSSMSSGACSTSTKVLVVPRPRNPYSKKNYNIDTLVPPFTSLKGGAGQGGYPEHWRLTSVYQHAYKPIEQRKQSLLQTVYK